MCFMCLNISSIRTSFFMSENLKPILKNIFKLFLGCVSSPDLLNLEPGRTSFPSSAFLLSLLLPKGPFGSYPSHFCCLTWNTRSSNPHFYYCLSLLRHKSVMSVVVMLLANAHPPGIQQGP